ncbi:MAG: Tol-Pal system protein TolB, partial [Hyphomonadaceae bacterium]
MTALSLLFPALCRALRPTLLALLMALAWLTPALAQLNVSVTEGHRRPMPIAIADFSGPHGSSIASAVRDNLARSGLFQVQNPDSFLQRDMDVNVAPRFADWRITKTEALVIG